MALSQALSEEEFHRMQAQLLELRTQNYQLSDELRKNSAELNSLRQKNVVLEKDFVKAQKAVTKSKKAQEVEALLGENEMLQSKLHSQEEDFRLQNSTLMTELSKLCTQIEQLEQENKALKEGGETTASSSASSTAPPTVNDELLQLQAENTSLHKKIKALQEQLDRDQGRTAGDGETSNTNGVSDVTKEKEPTANHRQEQTSDHSEQTDKRLSELELSLNTEKEAQRLLREQLKSVESSKHTETSKLQEEVAKLTDKLKKKQESFQRLQGEKEALYNDSRTKIDEINQRKEEELKALNSRLHKIQTDLLSANQLVSELREQIQSKDKEHELALHTLRDQIQTAKTQEMNLLREQQEALTNELQQKRVENESLLAQKDDLQSQLQESSFANRKLLEQLTDEGHEKDKLLRELDEAKKTAEKRKSMLDDMAIQLNQEKSDHKEALSDLKLQHEKEVLAVRARYEKELRGLHEDKNRSEEEIRQQLREEKAKTKELEGLVLKVEELQNQVQSMEGTKGWFERRLKEAEENLEQKILEHQEQVEKLQKEHSEQMQVKQSELEQVQQQLLEKEKQGDELNQTIDKLRQEIKDTVDGQRILEKKGSAALKDLKRQLQLERKRADKLQERLQDILTKTRTAGLEELNLSEIHSPSRTQQTGDSSSVSSFSFKDMMKEQPANQSKSGGGSPQSQRPADLSDDEVGELFQRLAEVQQEKWMLEEKVKHLEVSCSSMAEDICKKSAIIETYVMDSRRDVSGAGVGGAHSAPHTDRGKLGSVLRDLVKPGDDNLREMNKKLQHMLEEQLTKNMHLQKDLEVLSQELVRVSKDGSSSASG
ncbi:GRIP1-associated protein 1 isoform X2 [Boleophthalmus pectinirostris]|uniref:GRIP1-associated protein 1 isoform X2 n=1 Tax=Boleophthalmus pectinirostris TaxID=150288 RepID=UPI000A1C26D1|nr:GRIP1-associated protein 1 isoform X2 [Boleophthalmus pectinirostris]